LSWEFTPFTLPLIFSGLISLAVAAVMWRRRPAVGAGPLALAALAAALWSLENAAEVACTRLEDKLFWANLEYLSITAIPVLWFTLAARYASLGRRPTRSQLLLLFVIPAVTNLLVWTNEYHGLIRQNVRLDLNGPYPIVAKTYGPWLWVHVAYVYSLLAAGSVFFFRLALRAPRVYRGQAVSLLVAGLLPWVTNVAYLYGQGTLLRMDPTPIAFSLSGVAAAWGLFRYGLFDVVPAARDAVFASMRDGVMVVDAQGRIVDLNPAAQGILRCSERQVIGRSLSEALLEANEPLQRLSDAPEARTEVALGPAGQETTYDISISPLRDGQGRLAGRVITLRDITQRRQLEEQLRRSQKMDAVGLLAGGIAHHFNNLLTVVNGYSEFVLRSLEPSSPLREDVEAVLRAGTQAAELTRRLLVFSRFRKPQVRIMDLNETLRALEDTLRNQVSPDVTLHFSLATDAGCVEADPALIEQIATNLVANACDAMPQGGTLTIGTGHVPAHDLGGLKGIAAGPKHYAALWVSDSGTGMTPEVQAHLFEPFFTTKEVGEGTGLGLAMVYGIVEELHGAIEVDTGLGHGTTVRIYLPQAEPEPLAAAPHAGHAVLSDGSEVVMVVEDEEDVRRFVVQALRREGYTALEAGDGAEALAVAEAQETPIDLVLTDMVMPYMDGGELVRRLRALYPGIRALFMSGFPEDGSVPDGTGGTIPFLAKPFTADKIRDAVRRALANETITT
jgi:PAS domain S-box-containing protein